MEVIMWWFPWLHRSVRSFPSLNVVLVESHYLAKDKASALTSSWTSIKLHRNAAGSWWHQSGWNDWCDEGKHSLSDLISNHTDFMPTNCLSTSVTGYRQSPLVSKWTDGESFYCCCDVAHQRSPFISSTQAQGFSPATMDLRAYKCHTALFTCKTAPVWGWMGEFIDLIKRQICATAGQGKCQQYGNAPSLLMLQIWDYESGAAGAQCSLQRGANVAVHDMWHCSQEPRGSRQWPPGDKHGAKTSQTAFKSDCLLKSVCYI